MSGEEGKSTSELHDVELLEYETSTRVLNGSRLQCFETEIYPEFLSRTYIKRILCHYKM